MNFTVDRQVVAFQPEQSCFPYLFLFPLDNGFLGQSEIRCSSEFDLNEADCIVDLADKVNFTNATAKIIINDSESFFFQEFSRETLTFLA